MSTCECGQGEEDLRYTETLPLWSRFRMPALVIFLALVSFSAFQGWSRQETDFPNYYTAAWLVRKGEPLRNYYDWTWFQRKMNYAGIETQLGGYIPQTPLTMLPLVPIAGLPVQAAKRIWLLASLVFLGATLWLLSCITRFSVAETALLALVGYGALHTNLLLGQYYIFLLFLLTLSLYCLDRKHSRSGGFLLGAAFVLKLYGGPFILYFAARRHWRALAGMLAAVVCLGAVAVALFGWPDIAYFGTQILPRALSGETLDPYNPGNGTITTLLRRTFMREAELNQHPLVTAPWLFFFLRPLVTLLVLAIPLWAMRRSAELKKGFSWFLIALLLASPNTASYTFILLLLPVTVLMKHAEPWKRVLLLICYAGLAMPMRPSWNWLFPKVWFLVALFVLAGMGYWRQLRTRGALSWGLILVAVAAIGARHSMASYLQEPGQRWERIAVEHRAIYSSSPAVLRSGIVYESIGADRYVLRWLHGNEIATFSFPGQAFHPVALSPEGPVRFELVARGISSTVFFNPPGDAIVPQQASSYPVREPGISPDGKWIASTLAPSGTRQIWLRNVQTNSITRLTGGNCNSFDAAWELDSKGIIFASDCGRGIGLPALYRARLRLVPRH